ncbi:uncharacterized protein LOC112003309 [Quercus suber]|uniref:uncharacterized protein LOC112003309 n=1 Tax=Quercus suber TaxID=58331 RepID=UPI0032DF973E
MDSNLKNIPIKVLIFMLSPIYSTGSVVIVEEDMNCIYRDPNEPVEARIRDLLSRMTLKEKVGQMTQIERRVATPDAIKDLSIGGILSACGSGPFQNALSSDWADLADGFQKSALESRLGIPLIYGVDAVHGHNSVYGATIFPHNVGLGATRDADLVQKIGEATALEVRASGIHCTFAPCVAVCRDPRWGRCYESYSEDTEIVRKMTSIVTGLQGQLPHNHPKGYPFVAGSWILGTTILDAIKAAVGDETEVVYEQYPSADTLARQDFSFAIVAVGEKPYVESLDDNLELVIQLNGADIISSVADSIPTLVILVSGRPLLLEPLLLDKIDALIAAWLPGSEGGGIADVVFGDNDFKGRLPVTWFKQVEQLPLHIGIDSCDSLFPLGFGLTCNKERSLE